MMKQDQKSKIKDQNQDEGKSITVRLNGVRISAQKLNLTAKILRGKSLAQAQAITAFAQTKASQIISKLLKSAKAAAVSKGLVSQNLVISALLTNQGPSLKRGRPVARGTYHAIRKKSAHLVLTLKEVNYGPKN